jgi:hypothetical protein
MRCHAEKRCVMRRISLEVLIALLILHGLPLSTHAAEPVGVESAWLPAHSLVCPNSLLGGCCDCYCPKPQPCIRCYCQCCGPCDYCKKPFPWIPCYPCSYHGGCYCPKPCPDPCRPLAADFFTCSTGNACAVVTPPHHSFLGEVEQPDATQVDIDLPPESPSQP